MVDFGLVFVRIVRQHHCDGLIEQANQGDASALQLMYMARCACDHIEHTEGEHPCFVCHAELKGTSFVLVICTPSAEPHMEPDKPVGMFIPLCPSCGYTDDRARQVVVALTEILKVPTEIVGFFSDLASAPVSGHA